MEGKRRTASDTSNAHSPRGELGAYGERNLSSASNLPTPRSAAIGNTLTVCVEGKYLGILKSGMVDKRREGAVRAGFARRLFLLSVRGCHYYRKADESEIFGTERGHIGLKEFAYAKIVPEGEAPYGTIEPGVDAHFVGLFSKQHTLTWFLRVESHDVAKAWVSAISAAQEVAKKNLYPNEWTPEMFKHYTAILTGTPLPPSRSQSDLNEPAQSPKKAAPPSILAISISGTKDDARERLVTRKVDLQKSISIGTITLQETLHFVLNDQQVLTMKLNAYLSATNLSTSTTVVHPTADGFETKLQISLQATKAAPVSSGPTNPENLILPAPANAAALGFSALYLLSCLLAYIFGPSFQGIMQVTVIMGFFLSTAVIASGVLRFQSAKAQKAQAKTTEATVKLFQVSINIASIEKSPKEVKEDKAAQSTETASNEEVKEAPAKREVKEMAFSPRFIAAEKGNEEKGRARFQATLQWRRENRVDGMLYEPQPHFQLIKRNYPQYFHGKSIKGNCVYYERVGKINLKAMKDAGLTMDDLLRHYIYLTEYMWTLLEPSDSGRSVTVLDVDGIGFYDLTGDVTDFVRMAMGFVSAHYPERSAQIFIVNVPTWFNMLWRVFSPMIDPVTKEKIRICKGKSVKEELLKSIAEHELPADYGGTGAPLGQSAEEIALFKHVDDINNAQK